MTTNGLIYLHYRDLTPSPLNAIVRGEIDDTSPDIRELGDSIVERGVIQPLTVIQAGEQYQILTGERRWRAARLLGENAPLLPCVVKDSMSELDQLLAMGIENLQRQDMTPIAEAKYYRELERRGLTVAKISQATGKVRSHINSRLSLLVMAEPVQNLIDAGALPMTAAQHLAELPPGQQVEVANKMAGRSTRDIARVVAIVKAKAGSEPDRSNGRGHKADALADLKALSSRLILQLQDDGKLLDRCADALSACDPDLAGEVFERARLIERTMSRFQAGVKAYRKEKKGRARRRR